MRTSSETMPAGPDAPAAAERTAQTLAGAPARGGFYERVFESDPARGFVSLRNGVALLLYLAFTVTFASFRVSNDGLVYYDFLRRFFGEHVGGGGGYAYQFGVAFFNAPFWLAARAVQAVTGWSSAFGAPLPQGSIALASNVALGLTLFLGWKLLRRLELPAGPGVLLLALFGSPLFYYTAFQPSYKHAVDALFVTAVAYLLLEASESATTRRALLLGACLAYLASIRYANVGLVPGALLVFALARDWARTRVAVVALVAVGAVVFALPGARHIPYKRKGDESALRAQRSPLGEPPGSPRTPSTGPLSRTGGSAAGLIPHLPWQIKDPCPDTPTYVVNWSKCLKNKFGLQLDAVAPARMLVSERRGLFLWTPLTALSVLGIALLFRSRPERRRFLISLSVAAALLVVIHALWGDFWTNGFSFSQRFLAGLFPLYLLGTAELIRRFRVRAVAVATVCCLFSLFVGFNHFLGYHGISERDGLWGVLTTKGDRDVAETLRLIGTRALDRWGLR
jgi:hypothetical protein